MVPFRLCNDQRQGVNIREFEKNECLRVRVRVGQFLHKYSKLYNSCNVHCRVKCDNWFRAPDTVGRVHRVQNSTVGTTARTAWYLAKMGRRNDATGTAPYGAIR